MAPRQSRSSFPAITGPQGPDTYTENSAGTGGTLTISDGTNTANLNFTGDYVLANFKFSSDASGGTLILDPPVTDTQDTSVPPGTDDATPPTATPQLASDDTPSGQYGSAPDVLAGLIANGFDHGDAAGVIQQLVSEFENPNQPNDGA